MEEILSQRGRHSEALGGLGTGVNGFAEEIKLIESGGWGRDQ